MEGNRNQEEYNSSTQKFIFLRVNKVSIIKIPCLSLPETVYGSAMSLTLV